MAKTKADWFEKGTLARKQSLGVDQAPASGWQKTAWMEGYGSVARKYKEESSFAVTGIPRAVLAHTSSLIMMAGQTDDARRYRLLDKVEKVLNKWQVRAARAGAQ